MIIEAYKKSVVAKLYYQELGEKISNQEAVNRWRMLRNPDKEILKKVFSEIHKEQKSKLK
jgi:hypothetical protein